MYRKVKTYSVSFVSRVNTFQNITLIVVVVIEAAAVVVLVVVLVVVVVEIVVVVAVIVVVVYLVEVVVVATAAVAAELAVLVVVVLELGKSISVVWSPSICLFESLIAQILRESQNFFQKSWNLRPQKNLPT